MKEKRSELEEILTTIGSPSIRKVLQTLHENGGLTYVQLARKLKIYPEKLGFGETITDERKEQKNNSTRLSYYFRKLKGLNLIIKHNKTNLYILTRRGDLCLNLIAKFETIMEKYSHDTEKELGEIEIKVKIVGRDLDVL